MIIRPWRISWLLAIGGLILPPYLVLAHRLEGAPWWLVLIGTFGVGILALYAGHALRGFEARRSRQSQMVMALGLFISGGFFGALVAFFVAPLTGQFGLMLSAALLGLHCMAFNRTIDFGFTGFTLSYHRPSGGELRFSAGDDVMD